MKVLGAAGPTGREWNQPREEKKKPSLEVAAVAAVRNVSENL